MNIADWIIVVVLLISVIQAASSGFFQEAFGIAGLVFGYLIAAWEYRQLAAHFVEHMSSPWLAQIAAFLAIFIGVMILAGICGVFAAPVGWFASTEPSLGYDWAKHSPRDFSACRR